MIDNAQILISSFFSEKRKLININHINIILFFFSFHLQFLLESGQKVQRRLSSTDLYRVCICCHTSCMINKGRNA
jgi:hypothetical protein